MNSAGKEIAEGAGRFWRNLPTTRLRGKHRKWFRPGANNSPRMSQIIATANEIADAVELECRRVEPDFIRVGNDLEALFEAAGNLGADVGKSVRRISGDEEENNLYRVGDLAKETLSRLENRSASVEGTMNGITGMIDCLGDLYITCGIVEKISMVLRVVGLNMGVECSRTVESRELFHVVAGETRLLSERIIEIAREIREESSLARNNQMSMLNEVASVGDDLGKLQREAGKTVNRGVQQVEDLVAFSLETLQEAEKRSSVILQKISDVVTVMQSHDNIAQRIEHMSRALKGIQGNHAENSGKREARQNRKDRLASACKILEIQTAQLSDIIRDIEAWHERASEAFVAIYRELKVLVQHLSSLRQDETDNTVLNQNDSGDPFEVLERALTSLRKIIERGWGLNERVRATAKETADTTRKLEIHAEEVMRISKETHIMALNAIVKAARLGDRGRTLEALAQEVRNLSYQSEGFVKDVQGILERSTKASESLRQGAAGEFTVEPEDREGESKLDRAIQRISSAGEQFKNDSMRVFECADNVKNGFRQRKTSLDFLPALAQKLRGNLEGLQALELSLKPWSRRTWETDRDTSELVEQYTMKKERDIHGRIIGSASQIEIEKSNESDLMIEEGLPAEESMGEGNPQGDGREDELGSNVELF